VDDWAMAPLQETERRDFWEICEERYQTRPTILTSQVPVARWHEQLGDATIADGILDRLVHNAHRIELRGESMRKTRGKKQIRSRSPKGFYTNWGREKDSCAVPSSALHPARKKERRNTGE
jgi:IstB-like ATP binding protein